MEQHSLPATVAYFSPAPGLLILAVTVVAAPVVKTAGLPPIAALLLAFLFAQLPFQLSHLLILRMAAQRPTLAGRRSALPRAAALVAVPASGRRHAGLELVDLVRTEPDQHHLEDHTLRLAPPPGFAADQQRRRRGPSRLSPALHCCLAFGAYLILNVVAIPIVEELYFRGYLLPRLSRFEEGAVAGDVKLFTVYHFWQPWLYPAILVAFAAVVFPVYRTRTHLRRNVGPLPAQSFWVDWPSIALVLGGAA